MISLEKLKNLTPLQKLPKNVGYFGKLVGAKGFEKLPKSNKSPNLVTLVTSTSNTFPKNFFYFFSVYKLIATRKESILKEKSQSPKPC